MKYKKIAKKFLFPVLLLAGFLVARFVFAQDFGTEIVADGLGGALGEEGTDPRTVVSRVINIVLGFLAIAAVVIVLYAGFLWMSSAGEEDKITRAKQILKSGLIGLVIVLASWAIATFVIARLSGAIGGGEGGPGGNSAYCTNGATASCGCGGAMLCTNGSWGACIGSNWDNCTNPPIDCDASSLPGCQAANQICASGYFCDNNCLCQTQAVAGDSCDADLNNQTCDADNNRCGEYLTCNPDTCLCAGSPVITALSPLGGFCVNNINQACAADTDCSSGDTCNLTAANGTTNNFITVFGQNFGEYVPGSSQVLLASSGQDVSADFPDSLNPACVSFWRDDQIIIAIPDGAQTGPVKVVTYDGLIDSTADSYGPQLEDFVANNISRPSLCELDPIEGSLNLEVNYQGANLQAGQAYFGNYETNVSGLYSNFAAADGLSGSAVVPNIQAGQSGSFIEKVVDGSVQKSNYLRFVKAKEEADGPYIMSFSPSAGAAGQYITIKGAGFGGARGNSRVYFVSGENKIEASYSFPAICANSVWTDKQIIVKAPTELIAGSYYLEILLGNKIVSSQTANPNIFQFDSALALAPSLCKLEPEKGPVGTPVTFWGEYFGAPKTTAVVRFNSEKNVTGNIETQNQANLIKVNVPTGAVTGPVKIVKDNQVGNELNFAISECANDSECDNQVCCPSTTYKKGRCVNTLEECFIDVPTSVFEWKFSTSFGATFNPDLASCTGWSKYLGSCFQGAMCPNSPGACSAPNTSYTKVVGSCDISCNDTPGCTNATCTYNATLDRCVLKTDNIVSDCDAGELVAPTKNSDKADDKNVPRIMYWPGKINQHWNLSAGIWESDIDEKSGAQLDKLTYCQKFYPTTVRVEDYKTEFSSTWHSAFSRSYYPGTKMSYRCVLDTSINSVDLAGVKKTCNQAGLWEIKVKGSCPADWTRGANDTCTQDDVVCSSCPSSLSCEKVNLYNSCVSEKLCESPQANCVDKVGTSQDECILTVEPSCDCCCRIGFDAQDCCAPLTCAGTCGSDITNNTNTYGSCSGCAAVGSTPAEQDAACNCAGTSGKYCSITDATPQGICTDCAGLTTQESCGAHSNTCCFDSKNTASTADDICRAIGGDTVLSTDENSPDYGYCGKSNVPVVGDICNLFNNDKSACMAESGCCYNGNSVFDFSGSDTYANSSANYNANSSANYEIGTCVSGNSIKAGENAGYCAFYDCTSDNSGTCNLTPTTTGRFLTPAECTETCKNPGAGAGLDCVDLSNSLGSCNFDLCTFSGFKCLQENGLLGSEDSPASCGTCCCEPATATTADSCKTALTPDLTCQTDKGNCTGAGRGLCCGCSADSDCGSPSTVGCGTDTCCEARPLVTATVPTTSATGVCRNSAIQISFNQQMDQMSFKDNFFVFEEKNYGDGSCPLGSFIADADTAANFALAENKNSLQRFLTNLTQRVRRLFTKTNSTALAMPPNNNKLYCSIPGKISFVENAKTTDVIFTPDKVLTAATKYFILIKGDETLSSNTGVLSASKIGLNEKGFRSLLNAPVNPVVINNKTYLNSYSFSFTTLANQGGNNNNGLCLIESVSLTPGSHLFKTTTDSLTENDKDASNPSFDTAADGDKLFTAIAYSSDKQVLMPVDGYNWDWEWIVNNSKIATISNEPVDLVDNKKLLQAVSGVTDGQTMVSARVNMDAYRNNCGADCNAFFVGDKIIKASDLYVFLCENPWPAVQADGNWYPWTDSAANCLSSGTCDNFNYKFYYCRDAGEPGTFDDLPAINYSPISLTGNLRCSADKSPCTQAGSVCGSNNEGVCIWEILKESYFFRDTVITGVEVTDLFDTLQGGEARINWQSTASGVKSFKIYYLKSGQGTMLSKEVTPLGTGGVCTAAAGGQNFICSTKISGLVDGETYIFKISLISDSQTESPFSNEKTVQTSDQTPPSIPSGFNISASDTSINFTWTANQDKNVFYRLYYGLEANRYAGSFDSAPGVNSLTITRDKLTANEYYFAISALDAVKNESAKSAAIKVDLR